VLRESEKISFACDNMETVIIRDLSVAMDEGQYRCFSSSPFFIYIGVLIITGVGRGHGRGLTTWEGQAFNTALPCLYIMCCGE